jgi:hypothetical protein
VECAFETIMFIFVVYICPIGKSTSHFHKFSAGRCLVSEVIGKYSGEGWHLIEHLIRFFNRHRESNENAVNILGEVEGSDKVSTPHLCMDEPFSGLSGGVGIDFGDA